MRAWRRSGARVQRRQQTAAPQLVQSHLGTGEGGLAGGRKPRQVAADDPRQIVVADLGFVIESEIEMGDEFGPERATAEDEGLIHAANVPQVAPIV